MFRTLLLIFMAAAPFLLAYLFGFWVLIVIAVLAGLTFVCSTGKASGPEAGQGGLLTGYGTTSHADL